MALKAVILHGTLVIDGWLVAGLGEVALGGLGLAGALAGIALSAILAVAQAHQIRTAQVYGTGDARARRTVLTAGLAMGGGIGAAALLLLLAAGGPALSLLAPGPEVARAAGAYLTIFTLVILGESAGQILSSHFNGCGRAKVPLLGYALALPVNVGVSMALIHGHLGLPALGVAGAAWGSAAAVAVQVAVLALSLPRAERPGALPSGFATVLRRHLAFVAPIATTFMSAGLALSACQLIYARLPLGAFAAMTLVLPWIRVAGAIGMQWAQAGGIVVAQLLGARRAPAEMERFLRALRRGGALAAALVALVYAGALLSVDLLYPSLEAGTRETAASFLPLLIALPFLQQTNAICGNTLRASGDTIYVMNLFLVSQWGFRVPATALAVLVLDLPVFWVMSILVLDEILKLAPFHLRLARGAWKRARVTA